MRNRPQLNNIAQDIAGTIKAITRNPLHQKAASQYLFCTIWEEIVGEELSEFSRPERLINGRVLSILVPSSIHAQQIVMVKEEIIEKLASHPMGCIVDDIKTKVSGKSQFQQ